MLFKLRNHRFFCVLLISLLLPLFVQAGPLLRIKRDGVLRVGTTGDYPPLTYYDAKTQQFSGTDIDAAKALAHYLGVEVRFIKTTWPTLSNDLLANKFDIAMGGISSSPDREKLFLLSKPMQQSGKVPLIRCDDKNRFTSLLTIDHPDVIVVENAGGTNETFAKQTLKHAKLIVVPQNEMTFEYLLNHKADVMFTDSIEANYRHKLMPKLCAVNVNQPLTHDDKVYLLPKNSDDLLKIVNSNAWKK